MIKSSEKTPEVKCTDFFDGLVGRLIFRISTLMGDVYVTTRFLWLFQLDDEPNHYKKTVVSPNINKKWLFRVPGSS